jgi:ribose transport system substrate-binding protein
LKNQPSARSSCLRAFHGSAAILVALSFLICGCKKEGNGTAGGAGSGSTTQPSAVSTKREVHKAPDGAAIKLAFVTNNSSDFWNIAQKGIEKFEKEAAEKKWNVKVDMKRPDGTTQDQNRILDDLVTNGYNGIAVSPISPKDQTRKLNEVAAKTNLVCQDSDAASSNRLAYIGTNNYEAGKAAGDQIVKLLPDGGKIAVFVGTFSADNAAQRFKGIEDAIKGHNITVATKKEDNKQASAARANVDDVLTAQTDVKLLVGLWSYNGPQIAKGIEQSGKKGKVLAVVFDEESGTLDAIESGVIKCTVVQKPFEFGYQSSKMLYELAKNGESALPKDPLVDTKVTVIDSNNVKDFRTKLAELTK